LANGCSNTATINYFDSTYAFTLNKIGNTWCYTVVVTGPGGSTAPGLSHFILELCPDFTEANFSNITVTIDGNSVTPDYEIKTHVIDDGSGDTVYGIKFDNGVDKGETGVFCFTLNVNAPTVAGDLVVKGGNNDELLTTDAICTPGCPERRGVYCSL